jgi:hypothetical protein
MFQDIHVLMEAEMAMNVMGKAVRDENFFGREQELCALREATEHDNVLLLAPRRVGKTSLLLATETAERSAGKVNPVYVSVAGARSEDDFVRLLIDAAHTTPTGKRFRLGRLARWLRGGRTIKSVTVAGAGAELGPSTASWQERADAAFLALLRVNRPWLFLVDELPVVVLALAEADPSGGRARAFLQWFRHLRQRPEASKLRFVLAGSIGLDAITRRFAISVTINDLLIQRLGPFDEDTADRFLVQIGCAHDLELTPELRRCIRDHVEWWIPYHLQGVVAGLRVHRRDGITDDDVTRTIDTMLDTRTFFDSWHERLQDALGRSDRDHALAILGACAVDRSGATVDALRAVLARTIVDGEARDRTLRWILDVLLNDGYLVKQDDRWKFRSGLLRRYWQRYFA